MSETVIVTVQRSDKADQRDLEIPVDIEAHLLAGAILHALGWSSGEAVTADRCQLEALPLGRVLNQDETLASAEVWDGSWITVWPDGRPANVAPVQATPVTRSSALGPVGGPVRGWIPLDVPTPEADAARAPVAPETQAAAKAAPASSGFVWKRID